MYWSVLLKLVHVESSPINRQNFASRAQDLPVQQRILALTPGLGAGLDRVTGWNQSRNWRFSCSANFHAWPQARLWCGEWCPAGYQPYHWVFELIEAAAPGTGIWTCWLAVPCNSFSFMSISQHMRSFLKPYGDLTFAFVQAGNCICTRSCMLILVALARNVVWMIETPLRSSLDVWPFLNHIIHQQWLGCHRTSW